MRHFVHVPQEVPDSSDAAKADSSPVMKQSNDRMCSCDGEESCNCCNPPSPASSHDHAVDPEPVISTSSHLLEQLSRPSNPVSQKGRLTVPNPNYHLLQQLQKKQMTFGSASASTIAAAPSCDQPLDLSFNSTRAQQLPVATFSSSADATVKGQIDQNSLLDVVSGSTEMVLAAAPKYVQLLPFVLPSIGDLLDHVSLSFSCDAEIGNCNNMLSFGFAE